MPQRTSGAGTLTPLGPTMSPGYPPVRVPQSTAEYRALRAEYRFCNICHKSSTLYRSAGPSQIIRSLMCKKSQICQTPGSHKGAFGRSAYSVFRSNSNQFAHIAFGENFVQRVAISNITNTNFLSGTEK